MSKEIQFKNKLTLNKRADTGNSLVYFDVDPVTEQLIISGNNQSGVNTTLGGLSVEGDLFQSKGDAEIFRTLTTGATITAPDIRTDTIAGKTSTDILITGNVRVSGTLSTDGGNQTPGEVLIGDPIQVLNTEDPGPGVITGYSGIEIKRGYPVGQDTPNGTPGAGEKPSASFVWNEGEYTWDLNYLGTMESGNPPLKNVGTPTQNQENFAANVGYVTTYVAQEIANSISLDTLTDVTITGDLSTNRVLLNTGSQWEPRQFTITNLDDTPAPSGDESAKSKQFLRWNTAGDEIEYLSTIEDSVITGLASVSRVGSSTLPNLEDTTIGILAAGEVLRSDGTVWRNAVLDYSDISGQPTAASYELIGLADTNGSPVSNGYLRWDADGAVVEYETTIPQDAVTWKSTVAVSGSATIDNLENVIIDTPANKQALQFNGSEWINTIIDYADLSGTPTAASYELIGLADTNGSPVSNGYLRWDADGAVVEYETTIAASEVTGLADVAISGQGSLDYLTDTNIDTPIDSNVLRHDGTEWKNSILAFSDISGTPVNSDYNFLALSDTDVTAVANGYLRWDNLGTTIDYFATIPNADVEDLSTVAIDGSAIIDNLENVTIDTLADKQALQYNGSEWNNATLSFNDLTDVPNNLGNFITLSDVDSTVIPANRANRYLVWNGDGTIVTYNDQSSIQAGTATKLTTARTIALTGDVTGSATFDGSANTSITTTVENNSHTHTIANITNLQTALDGKLATTGTAANSQLLDSIDSSAFLRSNTNDYFTGANLYMRGDIVSETSYRDRHAYGTYDSSKTQGIWSMGVGYRSNAAGTNFGSLYGLAYKHTNNTTGGTMAGGHQAVWCQNGTGTAAIGTGLWTSGNSTAYSDRRVKTDIQIIPEALDKINKIHGYTYERTDIDIPRQTGVIAQEILEVLPEAVEGDEDHYSVAYGNLAGLLIEGIKELDTKNKELEAKNSDLEGKLEAMMMRIIALENKI